MKELEHRGEKMSMPFYTFSAITEPSILTRMIWNSRHTDSGFSGVVMELTGSDVMYL